VEIEANLDMSTKSGQLHSVLAEPQGVAGGVLASISALIEPRHIPDSCHLLLHVAAFVLQTIEELCGCDPTGDCAPPVALIVKTLQPQQPVLHSFKEELGSP
jgi:hypothetical protein